MVDRGFQLELLASKCSSYANYSHVFILGLILAYSTLSSHAQASSVNCKSNNISSKYQHCGIHPEGVHDLDCFGKYNSRGFNTCVWKPGNHASKGTYTLMVKQGTKYCKAYENITEISNEIKFFDPLNMTVEVFENSESTNCTKAIFRGSPSSLLRCGPPYNVSFSRQSGRLVVNVSWQKVDINVIKSYSVRYKALGSLLWSKAQSQNGETCTVENLNSSRVYIVQIQCVPNEKCTQCAWSGAYTVPSELTTQPVIFNTDTTDTAETKGRRRLSLSWKFSAKVLYDGFYVTIGKASGEAPCERMNTTQPEIGLILSYSAYHLNISAFNNASTSPAVSQIIPERQAEPSMGAGKLNVTVHSNTSFTIYWKDNLISNYVCYSVEWMKKGHKAAYKSFNENENNYRSLSPLPEPLEPYKRYSITLHTRPNKDTCNLKHINNSESTYGSTQFYFIEGSPVSAPTNVSSYSVTPTSLVLQWSSIPEEDIRGFLLGYIIHYTEQHYKANSTERNVTVDPLLTSYELADLKSGTAYKVQISGFTQAGAGVRSTASLFTTTYQEANLIGVITVFVVMVVVLTLGSPIIKRAKVVLWPSIPSPGKSNAMQKMDRPSELELLESIHTLKVEEWDTNSLQIIEKDVIPAKTLASMLPLLYASEGEGDSPEMTRNWIQRDTGDAAGDSLPGITAGTFSDVQRTDLQSSPFAFSSDYTTMEMFQQGMPQGVPVNTSVTEAMESDPEDTDLTDVRSGLEYIS